LALLLLVPWSTAAAAASGVVGNSRWIPSKWWCRSVPHSQTPRSSSFRSSVIPRVLFSCAF